MNIVGPDWPSTRALRNALVELPPPDLTLRWGNRRWNGWEQLVRFAQAGILCPLACNTLAEAREAAQEGIHLWGRKYHHTQGTDIVGILHPRWAQSDFWVEPVRAQAEYRQHVWDGKCIRVGRKVQTGPPTRRLPVRSRRNGWTLNYSAPPPEALREEIRQAARGAVASLGYVGGAVDVLVAEDGRVYVLEVNTAPALKDANTLGVYTQAIGKWAAKQA